MTKYIVAIFFGAAFARLVDNSFGDYEGAWQVDTPYPVRNVPNGTPPETVQRKFDLPSLDPGCVDRFPRLPSLAHRLNVPQTRLDDSNAVIEMCDGRAYDIFDILNALLDRMEKKL